MVKITSNSNVIFKIKNKPLLTENDNKLSGSFDCKAAKFWVGLQALALGVALGAAVVLTGGAALAVITVACVVSVAAGVIKVTHEMAFL